MMSKKKIDFKLPASKSEKSSPTPQEQHKIDSWVNEKPVTSSEKYQAPSLEKKRLSINIDKSLHNKLRERSIYEDKTVTTLVQDILKKHLNT